MIIRKAEFIQSATNTKQLPVEVKNEFVFCGRSNVGKSSFINMLLNRKNLARTSQKPGKTQTLNLYAVNDNINFIDVPGYGYASVSKKMREEFGVMIEDYLRNRKQLRNAFLLVDFRHEPTNDDCLMYNFFKHFNIPVTIIATKSDKVKRSQASKHIKIIKNKLELKETDTFIVTSAEERVGFNEVLDILESFCTI
ncbi:MAG: ribosome biogenesis GTP-binding protein YihA/YsxC [Anaeroplasmataceae bacterium]